MSGKIKLLSTVLCTLILSVTFLTFVQFSELFHIGDNIMKQVISQNCIHTFNQIVRQFDTPQTLPDQPVRQSEDKDPRTTFGLFLLMINAVFVLDQRLLVFMILLLAGALVSGISSFTTTVRPPKKPPDILCFLMMRFKFISQLEKLLENRAERYDTNPIFASTGIYPHSVPLEHSAGFFYIFTPVFHMINGLSNIREDKIFSEISSFCLQKAGTVFMGSTVPLDFLSNMFVIPCMRVQGLIYR